MHPKRLWNMKQRKAHTSFSVCGQPKALNSIHNNKTETLLCLWVSVCVCVQCFFSPERFVLKTCNQKATQLAEQRAKYLHDPRLWCARRRWPRKYTFPPTNLVKRLRERPHSSAAASQTAGRRGPVDARIAPPHTLLTSDWSFCYANILILF